MNFFWNLLFCSLTHCARSHSSPPSYSFPLPSQKTYTFKGENKWSVSSCCKLPTGSFKQYFWDVYILAHILCVWSAWRPENTLLWCGAAGRCTQVTARSSWPGLSAVPASPGVPLIRLREGCRRDCLIDSVHVRTRDKMRGWKGKPCSEGQACPAGGKLSQEHEERRMKGSSYETGLGKARSGREWVQTRREGQGLQVSRGEDKSTGVSTRFQPSVEQAGGWGSIPSVRLYPQLRCRLWQNQWGGQGELENSSNWKHVRKETTQEAGERTWASRGEGRGSCHCLFGWWGRQWSEQQWVRGYDSGKRTDRPAVNMQRLARGAVSLLDLATHRVVATHGPEASLHFRSRPPPHPSAAGVQGEVSQDSPVFRHTHTSVRLCGAAASRSLGVSVRTLPSLWGDSPLHLLSTSCLHLCPFLQWDIFSSPTDSSSTFLMVLMRTSKPIISGPASPRAPDLQPNSACLGALSSQPPSLDCSQMPTPEVFPPTSLSHPLDLLLNTISSKTFPDHIVYSRLHTVTLSSQLLLTASRSRWPPHGAWLP